MDPKEVAAAAAVKYVRDGMTLGIGTGSTSAFAIRAIAERVRQERLHIRAVPTSRGSRAMAEDLGIALVDLSDVLTLDLTIDGADEVDSSLDLIKGGGGALLREKIVAHASRELVIIIDPSKRHQHLGSHPLPVAVAPFGHLATGRALELLGAEEAASVEGAPQVPSTSSLAALRLGPDDQPYVTDDGLYIYDLLMGRIPNPAALARKLKTIPGVLEVGLFVGMASRVVIGYPDGASEEIVADGR